MAVQDTYNSAPARAYPGMVINGETSDRISRTVEDAGGIAFGKACFRGTGDRGTTGTPGAAGSLLGMSIADHGVQPLPGGVAADIYPQYSSAGIMAAGCIAVTAGVAVNDGDKVYITPAGVFTNVSNGGANYDAGAEGWEYDETVAGGAVVPVVRR